MAKLLKRYISPNILTFDQLGLTKRTTDRINILKKIQTNQLISVNVCLKYSKYSKISSRADI